MSGRTFVDTNILVYAHDTSAGAKHDVARSLVERLWHERTGAVSTQVLQELYVSLRRRAGRPLAREDAHAVVTDYLRWEVVVNNGQSILDAIAPHVKLPLILGATPAAIDDKAYLAERGVRIALQGHQPIRAAQQAIYATMRAMRDGTHPRDLEGLPSGDLMRVVLAEDDYDRWMKDYL